MLTAPCFDQACDAKSDQHCANPQGLRGKEQDASNHKHDTTDEKDPAGSPRICARSRTRGKINGRTGKHGRAEQCKKGCYRSHRPTMR